MPARYFDKFPTINYSNNEVVDITKRTGLLNRVSTNPYVFYPYEIDSFERPDQLSHRYYDDSYKSWILYISNKIVDPYYEWYMHDNEFVDFLTKKYGSYYNSQTKVLYYKNDWENSQEIDISTYDALPTGMKNYWKANLGNTGRTLSYARKQVDWQTNTNKIIEYTVSNTADFIMDEICYVRFDQNSTGRGQISSMANNKIYLQHVSGDFYISETLTITSNSYIYGSESNSNTIITDVISAANNIVEEEIVYWRPITGFEHELSKNEFNKSIRVIDSNFKQTMVDNLTELMSE